MRALALAALILVGCVQTGTDPTSPPDTSPPRLSEVVGVDPEEIYLDQLYAYTNSFERITVIDVVSDAELIEFGYSACEMFRQGVTFNDVATVLSESSGDFEFQTDMAFIVGTASGALCPELDPE